MIVFTSPLSYSRQSYPSTFVSHEKAEIVTYIIHVYEINKQYDEKTICEKLTKSRWKDDFFCEIHSLFLTGLYCGSHINIGSLAN